MNTEKNALELDNADKKVLAELLELDEDDLIKHLRDLRAERTLEYQIYATREQWLWIPWTTCLAAAVVAFTSPSGVIRIGAAVVTGLFAFWIAHRRRAGLLASYDALNVRHKWVVTITSSLKATARLKTLGFDDRLLKLKDGSPLDKTHVDGFRYPLDARVWTVGIWIGLILVAVLSCFLNWPPKLPALSP